MTVSQKISEPPQFGLHRVHAKTTSVQEILPLLIQNGGVIVEGLISKDILQDIENEMRPHFQQGWDTDAMFSKKTRVVCGLPDKSPTLMNQCFGNSLFTEVCDAMLTAHFTSCFGEQTYDFHSPPVLNGTVAFSTLPGNPVQRLHRDDNPHHNNFPAITSDQYEIGRDCIVNLFVAGTQTTKENGATRFIPGSHLQQNVHTPDESQAVYIELQPGDAWIMLGSTFHAASSNMTDGEERILYMVSSIKSFLRQMENIYLTLPLEKVREYSPWMQKRLGFSASSPLCGHIDLKDPREVLGLPEKSELQWFYD
ncbi:phytanoyl-CoA dioxygenase family protein [Penicillium taxi]|uniref:phytanoyl-CoA dioxygenase family protein n=1 Tax=Penicillium taxi TaxID=168475 RepID=UPI002545B3A2|nr:phytanoyl-CoA dioxygenase family protein [Penicillium taxi]KAJ5895360.1 phytanoyl-CoA dioxygenase family protein [Penicillium taxi]